MEQICQTPIGLLQWDVFLQRTLFFHNGMGSQPVTGPKNLGRGLRCRALCRGRAGRRCGSDGYGPQPGGGGLPTQLGRFATSQCGPGFDLRNAFPAGILRLCLLHRSDPTHPRSQTVGDGDMQNGQTRWPDRALDLRARLEVLPWYHRVQVSAAPLDHENVSPTG